MGGFPSAGRGDALGRTPRRRAAGRTYARGCALSHQSSLRATAKQSRAVERSMVEIASSRRARLAMTAPIGSEAILAPGGLAADGGDRDVAHCGIGLGAVPVAFAGLDVHDVADIDL